MKINAMAGIFLLSILLLVSCKQKNTEIPNSVVPPQLDVQQTPSVEDMLAELPETNYDGYEYRILVRKGSMSKQYFDEPQDNVVDDAIYRRNKSVEEKYGVKIVCTESNESNTDTSALNSILAGDDAYDIIFTHSRSAFTYAVQGACLNVRDVSSIHLDRPWWFKDIVDGCTLNNRLYVLSGDISMETLSHAMCLFFNKRIFDELGFEYPYEMVKNGEWTFDEFSYLVRKGGKDLSGDGIISAAEDQFGFVTQEWYGPVNILYAGGERIISRTEDGSLKLSLYSTKTAEIFDEFFSLMDNSSCHLMYAEDTPTDFFAEGRAMISSGSLGQAPNYRNMEDDFGILPFPLFDEDDGYHTISNGVADLAVIPQTVSDAERTGAITEALCAYGSAYVTPAFYDISLKTKYSRDDESAEMMDVIKNGLVFDIGYLAGSPYGNGGRDIARTSGRDFSSWYAARESAAQNMLEEFYRDYAGK